MKERSVKWVLGLFIALLLFSYPSGRSGNFPGGTITAEASYSSACVCLNVGESYTINSFYQNAVFSDTSIVTHEDNRYLYVYTLDYVYTFKVTAQKEGIVTIKFYNSNNEMKQICYVVVTGSNTLKYNNSSVSITEGKTKTVTATALSGLTVKYSSSDTSVAKVNSSTGKITAVSAGKATITATAYCNGFEVKSIEKTVTVKASKKVKLNTTSKVLLVGEKTTTLKLLNYSGSAKKVKWSTTNKSVVRISGNGKKCTVKAKSRGTAYVKAKVNGKTYKCKIVVRKASQPQKNIKVEAYSFLNTTILKSISGVSSYSVTSKNTSIVTVSDVYLNYMGQLRCSFIGVSEGSADVVATVNGVKYKIKVTVVLPEEYKVYNAWRTQMEVKLWTSSMTDLEKITAFVDYMQSNYRYDSTYYSATCFAYGNGGDCKASSELVADLAEDLGLKWEYYGVTSSLIAGHRITIVYIDGISYSIDATLPL